MILIPVAAAWLLIAVGAFVWLHSGGPGDAACERALFVPSDGFSAWPPGARCSYGEPAQTEVTVNGWFAVVAVVVTFAFGGIAGRLSRLRSSDHGRTAASVR